MTVRTIHPPSLAAAQAAWLEDEYTTRAAYADMRLDNLDKLALVLTRADLFDNAYAIWDDFIDGRRADERAESLTTPQLREQASIFARISRYIGPADLIDLANRAWGAEPFEVFTRNMDDGSITGKLGWHGPAVGLNIRVLASARQSPHDYQVAVWMEGRRLKYLNGCLRPAMRLALHPVFGRADS